MHALSVRLLACAALFGLMLSAIGTPIVLSPVQAETREERIAAAREYIAVSQSETQIQQMAEVSARPMLDVIQQQQPELFAEKGDTLAGIVQEFFRNEMATVMANQDELLADVFTLTELNALTEFYSTDAGRSAMEKMPQFLEAIQPQMMTMIQQKMPELFRQLEAEGVKIN